MKEIKAATAKPTFVQFNQHNGNAIGAIHRLRAGFNYCDSNAKLRHLALDDRCNECGVEETEAHVMTECVKYDRLRQILQKQLMDVGVEWQEMDWLQVVLYGARYETQVARLIAMGELSKVRKADAAIKKFHVEILKDRSWCYLEENATRYLKQQPKQAKITDWLFKSS
ncbi:unnamed protein product [Blepharisma stoltei]|uniref:Reverse transcriptase zinc-binding domain-containing protein n=1 Tax=Blepharisma stoltei TaxID=1481888 RepID=A0AAU9JNT9_9CILI|nr:unnamed protein product [Blepharisma stoltei]